MMFRKLPFNFPVLKFINFVTLPNLFAFFSLDNLPSRRRKIFSSEFGLKQLFRRKTSHFPSLNFYSLSTTIPLPAYKLLKIEFWSVPLKNFDGFPIPSNLASISTHNVNDRRFPESDIIEDDDKEYPLFPKFFLLLHNVYVCRGKISIA